ncbi:MAG: hypothetical protein RL236_1506, partial [Pseudomonadota bacterium]
FGQIINLSALILTFSTNHYERQNEQEFNPA